MKKRKHSSRKRELPITGILVAIVLVLLIGLGVLVGLTRRTASNKKGVWEKEKRQTETMEQLTAMETEEEQTEPDGEGDKLLEKQETEEEESEAKQDLLIYENGSTTKEGATKSESEKTGSDTGMKSESEPATESEAETETESEQLVVAIDPGHQGSWVDMSEKEPNGPGSSEMKAKATTGTQGSFSGKTEYELNLEISLLLRKELEKRGYRVVLTREDNDTAISNARRAQLAYEEGGDIYVRIHANGSDDASVQGALAMVPSANNPYIPELAEDSYTLAECILSAYCEKASFSSLGIQYYDNMTGINWSKLPVMILEMGFMTNQSDDLRMADASVQPLMAEGIADGIDAYFEKKGMKSKTVSKEAAEKMNALLEMLGEEFVYPAMEQKETWAISLADLSTGAQGDLNGDVQMASASVMKVFLMAAIYDRVCYPASETRHISFSESYDGELKQLITDMITVSDNAAANTLLEGLGGGDASVGMAVVNQYCQENGYTQTSMGRKFLEAPSAGDNLTSANDCRNLLAAIWQGTCVNTEASGKMREYLKNQTRTGKIPAGISDSEAVTANKTGELAGDYGQYVENDIAVVEHGGHAYVLCVLSSDLQDNGTAISRIQELSGQVYANLEK